ncbi:DUF4261 domain-containing protein [Roseibium sediminicola]|uniref:DUF4261 domain-containing protein n=1 Tax=Roseibium sediminicola TaxID=2933272 RepID=A0ABT0GRS1_9HYPH|nr:DUF4261 domain-containing protein [Roseibium sp. CAU 1639]MCK7611925.1 DUF4261 domain-containing protein [Roseibium sp. CAU 1639]
MQIHPVPSVDAQVLYQAYHPIIGRKIFDFIVQTAESFGLPAEDCRLLDTSTETDIRVLCGNYHCLVTQSVALEDKQHLQTALEAHSVRSSFPDAADLIQSATAYTQISVQKGVLPNGTAPSVPTAFCDTEEAGVAMAFARAITRYVVSKRRASVVFWGSSLFLMKPETFLELDRDETADLIYLHPHLYGETVPETGQQLFGVFGAGAHALIGHALEFRPCAVPPNYLVQKLYEFLLLIRRSGRVLRDGEVFGKDENEKIQVLHHMASDGGPPEIELKILHNPALGIVREEGPTDLLHDEMDFSRIGQGISDDEDRELNPHDPIDAAILEQLRSRNKKAPEPGPEISEEDESDQAFSDLDPQTASMPEVSEPEQPEFSRRSSPPPIQPSKRVSMEELRSFAQQAQASEEDTEQRSPKRGLLGKLFGKKSG